MSRCDDLTGSTFWRSAFCASDANASIALDRLHFDPERCWTTRMNKSPSHETFAANAKGRNCQTLFTTTIMNNCVGTG